MKPGIYLVEESGNLVIWYPTNGTEQGFEYYRDYEPTFGRGGWFTHTISILESELIEKIHTYKLVSKLW